MRRDDRGKRRGESWADGPPGRKSGLEDWTSYTKTLVGRLMFDCAGGRWWVVLGWEEGSIAAVLMEMMSLDDGWKPS